MVGRRSAVAVKPDETVEVDDDAAENYDLNANFVRVDGGTPPPAAVDAPAPSPEVAAE